MIMLRMEPSWAIPRRASGKRRILVETRLGSKSPNPTVGRRLVGCEGWVLKGEMRRTGKERHCGKVDASEERPTLLRIKSKLVWALRSVQPSPKLTMNEKMTAMKWPLRKHGTATSTNPGLPHGTTGTPMLFIQVCSRLIISVCDYSACVQVVMT